MAKVIGNKVIMGTLSWFDVETKYAKYKDDVLAYIDTKGFMIKDGECVPKPVEDDNDE